jgi:hypothetical protein
VFNSGDSLLAEDLKVIKRTLLDSVSGADVLVLSEDTLGRGSDVSLNSVSLVSVSETLKLASIPH